MSKTCLNCGQGEMVHEARDVSYEYKGHHASIAAVRGWHCPVCREVEFDAGEGVRFAEDIKKIASSINAKEASELE